MTQAIVKLKKTMIATSDVAGVAFSSEKCRFCSDDTNIA